jgi:hypothetical protein
MSSSQSRQLSLFGAPTLLAAAVLGMACSSAGQTIEPAEAEQPSTAAQAISIADAATADAYTPVIEVDAGSPEAPPWQTGQCAAIQVTVSQRIPTVWLVVDGSGSMQEALSTDDTTSRWSALRGALLDPDEGIVKNQESRARWGLIAFDGPLDGVDPMTPSGPAMGCPRLVEVSPALDNFAALDAAFSAEPLGGSTPTDKALESLLPRTGSPDDGAAVILLTDGQPNDFCSNKPVDDVRLRVVEHVKTLTHAGHNVYVVSLAGDDPALAQHLSDVAKASGTAAHVYAPKTSAQIRETISDIVGVPNNCEVLLSGNIRSGDECQMRVQLSGETLDCNVDDGWRLKDARTIEVTGEPCERYRADPNAELSVDIPCELIEL